MLFWPDPENCRGAELTPLDHSKAGKNKRCWSITGRSDLFEIYSKNNKYIHKYLNDFVEDRGPPATGGVGFGFYLVGYVETKIYPVLLLHCEDRDWRKSWRKCVEESEWWKKFKTENPLFVLMERDAPPMEIASQSDEGNHQCGVYDYGQQLRSFGTSVLFSSDQAPGSPRKATLGAVFKIDEQLYGLSVAHAASGKPPAVPVAPTERSHSNRRYMEVDSFGDSDEDDDSDVANLECHAESAEIHMDLDNPDVLASDIAADQSSIAASAVEVNNNDESAQAPIIDIASTEPGPAAPKQIGTVILTSADSPSSEDDWSLSALDESVFRKAEVRPIEIDLLPETSLFRKPTFTQYQVAEVPRTAEDVVVLSSLSGLVRGRLDPVSYFYLAEGQRRFVETFRILMRRPLALGDCGSWVLNADPSAAQRVWYGHVVAQTQTQSPRNDATTSAKIILAIAYMIPATVICDGIRHCLALGRLPLQRSTNQHPRQLQTRQAQEPAITDGDSHANLGSYQQIQTPSAELALAPSSSGSDLFNGSWGIASTSAVEKRSLMEGSISSFSKEPFKTEPWSSHVAAHQSQHPSATMERMHEDEIKQASSLFPGPPSRSETDGPALWQSSLSLPFRLLR